MHRTNAPHKRRTNAQMLATSASTAQMHKCPIRSRGIVHVHLCGLCVHKCTHPMSTAQDDLFTGRMEPMPAGPTIATEAWIARRLRRFDLFAGVTTADERRERVRAAILEGRMADAIAGKRSGAECETWSALFLRVYQQPLERGKEAA